MDTAMRNALFFLSAAVLAASASATPPEVWREAFQSSPAAYELMSPESMRTIAERLKIPLSTLEGMKPTLIGPGTLRYRIAVSAAGTRLRLRLSNEEGSQPITLSAVTIALAGSEFSALPGSLRAVSFAGKSAVSIPSGAPVVSDPVDVPVEAASELLVTVVPTRPLLVEPRGGAAFVSAAGDQSARDELQAASRMTGRPLVTGIAVSGAAPPRVIVALGDSITDGARAELGVLRGWPEELARRLRMVSHDNDFAVVNAAIAGNRLLAPGWGAAGLARLDRDVLRIEGASHLLVLEGINDIGMSGNSIFGNNPEVSADDLIAGYRQVIVRAHARGLKVLFGTLLPAGGSFGHSSPAKDAVRAAVNHWIRTAGEADGVIDFDAALRDPRDPEKLRKEYDSGDHLHPNEAGYKAMGDAIDLKIFS